MDRLVRCQEAIQKVLDNHNFRYGNKPDVETQILVDRHHNHYQLMRVGWDGSHRVYHVILHFDIKNDKIWIQHNMTDSDVAEELMSQGVQREDIVLGLQPAYKRELTGYAAS
jgi:XisI protein